jgi:FKBP-type peptidyl-prolyl cis-trans isomerase
LVISLVGLVALLLYLGDSAPAPGTTPTASGVDKDGKLDDSHDGMSPRDKKPPHDTADYKDIGDGVRIWDVVEGTGKECLPGANVRIHYTGWTLNGNPFDTTLKGAHKPAQFDLNRLIAGWQKGIPGMKPGGIRRIFIPSKLGYGASGMGRDIPPNADLLFEVKLIKSE